MAEKAEKYNSKVDIKNTKIAGAEKLKVEGKYTANRAKLESQLSGLKEGTPEYERLQNRISNLDKEINSFRSMSDEQIADNVASRFERKLAAGMQGASMLQTAGAQLGFLDKNTGAQTVYRGGGRLANLNKLKYRR